MKLDLKGYSKTSLSNLPLTDFWGDLDTRWFQVFSLLKPILDKYKNPKILDLAMGSGLDTLRLLKLGYNVVSNELDTPSIAKALSDAKKQGVNINLRKVARTPNFIH